MSRINPLLRETWAGLGRAGRLQLDYLNYLLVQAAVLFFAWPKNTLGGRLDTESGPLTLLAVVITAGFSIAYYSIRVGAEETLLPGQHALREWRHATPLSPGRIVRGYLAGHLLQSVHLVVLSSPLLLLAYAVSGSDWPGLIWSVTAALFQATFYRLLGAAMTMSIGHYERLMSFALRAVLLLGYLLTWAWLPAASHWRVSAQLLDGGGWPETTDFLLIYTGLCALLTAVLYRLLARRR